MDVLWERGDMVIIWERVVIFIMRERGEMAIIWERRDMNMLR